MRATTRTLILLALLTAAGAPRARAQGGVTRSPHGTLPAALDCTSCHTSTSWKELRAPLAFDHARQTRFPLEGQHARASCLACHLDAKFDEPRLSVNDCSACHADVHQGRLGTDCASCHAPTRFRDVNGVGLHVRTGFPLTGAHLQVACTACHGDARNGAYAPVSPECVACHRKDYAGATVVDHVAAGFPTDCRRCHSDLTWHGGVSFDHLSASAGKFALVGAPPPCLDCHTVNDWHSDFDHGAATNGKFPLVGAHVSLQCSSCHAPGTFTPLWNPANQNDCVACHQAQYDQNHAGSGFPTTCLTCHNVNSWANASFTSHDAQYFPIYSGAHAGQWNSCATCHTVPSDYLSFTCLSCHTHDQGTTDSHHTGVNGYTYTSQACYSCHPRGRSG